MTEPLVRICIPTYNGAKYLRQCLDSCLSQTYASTELVICDDGSSDDTLKIIEDYVKTNSRVRFFKNEKNLGLVGNWNRCIELAKGEWIKFVFQDDYITNDCIQEFVSNIEPHTVLMVSERNFILPENSSIETRHYYENGVRTLRNTTGIKGKRYSPELIARIAVENMCMNFIGEPSLSFFRKNVTNELGAYNKHLKQICDLEFVLRVASVHGLLYIPKKICAFRIHADSTTSTNIKHKYFELRYLEPLLFSYFLLYDASYKNLRYNLNPYLTLKLHLYFKVKAYNAYTINVKENHNHYLFKENIKGFEEIKAAKRPGLIVKLVALFKK
jgi:glycosyltransferase involved in cell wall biosynthesis